MALTANTVAQHVEAEFRALAAAQPHLAAAAGPAQTFCSIWPQAKPILAFIASIAAVIPGLGATAAAVLNGLIKVGDATAAEICN